MLDKVLFRYRPRSTRRRGRDGVEMSSIARAPSRARTRVLAKPSVARPSPYTLINGGTVGRWRFEAATFRVDHTVGMVPPSMM